MADLVTFATVRSQLDASGFQKGATDIARSADQATASVNKLDDATVKAGRNASLSADGWQKFLGRIDPATRATQQYAGAQSKLNDYVTAGLVPQGELAVAQKAIQEKFEASAVSGGGLTRTLEGLTSGYSVLTRTLGALGLAIGVGALVQFGKEVLENAGSLEHEAKVLGLSTSQYQIYREAARLAGVSVDSVDLAIRRGVASAGAAVEATGAQRTAYADLGITARDLAEGPGSYLPKVAAALVGITDQTRKAHDEVAIFGRSGQEINPVLAQWAQGADALSIKLKAMGLVMGDDVAKKAEDAEIRMSAAFDRLKVSAAPTIVTVTNWLTDLLGRLETLSGKDWQIRLNAYTELALGGLPGYLDFMKQGQPPPQKKPQDILSSTGSFAPPPVLQSQGNVLGQPAEGTPGTSSWDQAGWTAYLSGRKEEARLTGLSANEQAAEREAIAESVKMQELNGIAADKINHTYSGTLVPLGQEGLLRARNIGMMSEQNKAAEKVNDTFEKYLSDLTEEVRQASLSASAKEHEADVIKAAQDYQKQHNALARNLVQTYQDAVAVLGQQRVAQVDVLVTQKQAAELNQTILVPMREQIALLGMSKAQRGVELQLFQLRLRYGDAAVAQMEAEIRANDRLISQDELRQSILVPQQQQIITFAVPQDQRQTELEVLRLKTQYGEAFNATLEAEYRLNQKIIDQHHADDTITQMREELSLARLMPDERAQEEAVLREMHATHGLLRQDQADEIRLIVQQQQELQRLQDLSQGLADDYGKFFKTWLTTGKADFKTFGQDILGTWADMLAKMQSDALAKQLFSGLQSITGIGDIGGAAGAVTGRPTGAMDSPLYVVLVNGAGLGAGASGGGGLFDSLLKLIGLGGGGAPSMMTPGGEMQFADNAALLNFGRGGAWDSEIRYAARGRVFDVPTPDVRFAAKGIVIDAPSPEVRYAAKGMAYDGLANDVRLAATGMVYAPEQPSVRYAARGAMFDGLATDVTVSVPKDVRYAAMGMVLNGPTLFKSPEGPVIGGELGRHSEALVPLVRRHDGDLAIRLIDAPGQSLSIGRGSDGNLGVKSDPTISPRRGLVEREIHYAAHGDVFSAAPNVTYAAKGIVIDAPTPDIRFAARGAVFGSSEPSIHYAAMGDVFNDYSAPLVPGSGDSPMPMPAVQSYYGDTHNDNRKSVHIEQTFHVDGGAPGIEHTIAAVAKAAAQQVLLENAGGLISASVKANVNRVRNNRRLP